MVRCGPCKAGELFFIFKRKYHTIVSLFLEKKSNNCCFVHIGQGKVVEGIVHLERIANMKEPEDPKSKTHYCDALFMLSRFTIKCNIFFLAKKIKKIHKASE